MEITDLENKISLIIFNDNGRKVNFEYGIGYLKTTTFNEQTNTTFILHTAYGTPIDALELTLDFVLNKVHQVCYNITWKKNSETFISTFCGPSLPEIFKKFWNGKNNYDFIVTNVKLNNH